MHKKVWIISKKENHHRRSNHSKGIPSMHDGAPKLQSQVFERFEVSFQVFHHRESEGLHCKE